MRKNTLQLRAPRSANWFLAAFFGAIFFLSILPSSFSQCVIPSGLSSTTISATSAKLAWAAVPGASGYTLHVENANNNPAFFNVEFGVGGNNFTIGLPAGGNYKFKVRTVCGGNKSNWSADFFFSTGSGGAGGGGGGSCGIPTGLSATSTGATSAALAWANVSGASGYMLEIESASGNPMVYKTSPSTTSNSFNVSNLPISGNYKFKVRAVCSGIQSDWSAVFFFIVGGNGGGGTGGGSCGVPTGLSATSQSGTTVKLAWNAVAGASGYSLQIESNNGNPAFFNVEFPVSSNVFTAGVPVSGNYKFKVRSVCGGAKSDWAVPVAFTVGSGGGINPPPPPPPTTGNYCASKGSAPWQEWIGNVKIGQIEKESEKNQYGNFISTVFNVGKGAATEIRLTTNYSWETFDEYWKIWVDLNKNGTFEEPGEVILQKVLNRPPNGTSNARVFSTITIPTTAPTGTTRMRISMKRGGYATPCETFDNGEVEDYTINIVQSLLVGEVRNEATLNLSEIVDFAIFPQPASDFANLDLEKWVGKNVNISIFNQLGKPVRTFNLREISEPVQTIDLSGFDNGQYWVQLRGEGERPVAKKLIVSRLY